MAKRGRPKKIKEESINMVSRTPQENNTVKYELAILNYKFAFNGNWWKVSPDAEKDFIELIKITGKEPICWNGF